MLQMCKFWLISAIFGIFSTFRASLPAQGGIKFKHFSKVRMATPVFEVALSNGENSLSSKKFPVNINFNTLGKILCKAAKLHGNILQTMSKA